MLLTTKQSKVECIEHFLVKLEELSENCEHGKQEATLITPLYCQYVRFQNSESY